MMLSEEKKCEPLVSIITPCYNGEEFIKDYFEMILKLEYTNLELFFVNDGSTDRTEEYVLKYMPLLKDYGVRFEYIKKENGGVASAINRALPRIRGKYFFYPDIDDIVIPDSIQKKVQLLEEHEEYGLLIGQAKVIDKNGIQKDEIIEMNHNGKKRDLIKDYIMENNVIFCPGVFLFRTEYFRKINPQMQIYVNGPQGGQNYQFLLPMIYHYPYTFLDEIVYLYRVYAESHSNNVHGVKEKIIRWNCHENTILEVLKIVQMTKTELYQYEKLTKCKFARQRMELYKRNSIGGKDIKKEFWKLVKNFSVNKNDIKIFLSCSFPNAKNLWKKMIR